MRKMRFLLALLAMVLTFGTASARDKVISETQLPRKAQSFLKKHFPQQKIASATEEREDVFWKEYKVILTTGNVVEFNSKGEWKEVKSREALPASVVPQAIAQYVKTNFPQEFITKIKQDKAGYEVELNNGLDVKFNKAMQYIRIDD